MIPFDFQPRTRLVFGADAIDRLGELARELGGSRALVVTDPGIIAAGHLDRAARALESVGVAALHFDDVHENPTTFDVDRAVAFAREARPDVLVGLGGGSSLDCAKGLNFIHTNGGRMQDYWGVGKASRPMLPMIAVPTTTGTGSEMQSFALISDPDTHAKMACGDVKASCRVAVLDPTLAATQPRRITALSGIDAISHALESFVSTKSTGLSRVFSREAWRLLATNFTASLERPFDLEARGAMQLGAAFAGWAIENAMLGAAHALANPLTARRDVIHGQAVGVMLPHVVRYNAPQCGAAYAELLRIAGGPAPWVGNGESQAAGERLADFLEELLAAAGLSARLAAWRLAPEDLPALADDAAKQWTGRFNPRPIEASAFLDLYRQAY